MRYNMVQSPRMALPILDDGPLFTDTDKLVLA
jgi:hypothetical protein